MITFVILLLFNIVEGANLTGDSTPPPDINPDTSTFEAPHSPSATQGDATTTTTPAIEVLTQADESSKNPFRVVSRMAETSSVTSTSSMTETSSVTSTSSMTEKVDAISSTTLAPQLDTSVRTTSTTIMKTRDVMSRTTSETPLPVADVVSDKASGSNGTSAVSESPQKSGQEQSESPQNSSRREHHNLRGSRTRTREASTAASISTTTPAPESSFFYGLFLSHDAGGLRSFDITRQFVYIIWYHQSYLENIISLILLTVAMSCVIIMLSLVWPVIRTFDSNSRCKLA